MRYKYGEAELNNNRQANDAMALLDLLNEHYHTDIKMTFSHAHAGRAKRDNSAFTIPEHSFAKGETYLFYYVIHEFTHCLGYRGHNKEFKKHERQALALFNIDIEYARAYPRTLYANGERVYYKKSHKNIKHL